MKNRTATAGMSAALLAGMLALEMFAVIPVRAQAQQQNPPPAAQAPAPAQTASPAAAQAAAPEKIDPAKEASILKLFDIVGTRALLEQTVKNMTEMSRASLAKSLPQNESAQKFIELFFQKLQARLQTDDFIKLIMPIYDKYLTTEDVEGLIRFYESPLGQRALKVLPQIAQESQTVGFHWGERLGQEIVQEVFAEHPELKQQLETPPSKP